MTAHELAQQLPDGWQGWVNVEYDRVSDRDFFTKRNGSSGLTLYDKSDCPIWSSAEIIDYEGRYDHAADAAYYKRLAEAAGEILNRVPIGRPYNNVYLSGFDESLANYQQIKNERK